MKPLDLEMQTNSNDFPNDRFWTLPNLKSLQTTILNLNSNGRMFSKWVQDAVGKGDIARYEQFLLFPPSF